MCGIADEFWVVCCDLELLRSVAVERLCDASSLAFTVVAVFAALSAAVIGARRPVRQPPECTRFIDFLFERVIKIAKWSAFVLTYLS